MCNQIFEQPSATQILLNVRSDTIMDSPNTKTIIRSIFNWPLSSFKYSQKQSDGKIYYLAEFRRIKAPSGKKYTWESHNILEQTYNRKMKEISSLKLRGKELQRQTNWPQFKTKALADIKSKFFQDCTNGQEWKIPQPESIDKKMMPKKTKIIKKNQIEKKANNSDPNLEKSSQILPTKYQNVQKEQEKPFANCKIKKMKIDFTKDKMTYFIENRFGLTQNVESQVLKKYNCLQMIKFLEKQLNIEEQ